MTAAQWAARFAARTRPRVPGQVYARYARAVGMGPAPVHRAYPFRQASASQNAYSAAQGHAGLVGGVGYTHSTAPGSAALYNPTQRHGHH